MFEYETIKNDIYFQRSYAELYQESEDKVLEFSYVKDGKILQTIIIAKPIKSIRGKEIDEGYYDASSPYGYSGLITNTDNNDFLEEAISAFRNFCLEHKVVAVFFRFNPFATSKFLEEHLNFYTDECPVVYIDLEKSDEERFSSYSSGTRNILRKCLKNLTVEEVSSVEAFLPLYYATMNKNAATDFYYFSEDYFKRLVKQTNVKLFHVMADGIVLSAGFFFYSGKFAHYHLSANHSEKRQFNGNYLLLEHAAKVGKSLDCSKFLLGGGRTAALDDGLLKFKSKFSPLKATFNIGGVVINDEVYQRYGNIWQGLNLERKVNFFLKYRLN